MEKESYKYAKVPYAVVQALGLANIRKRVADDMVIINQSDIRALEGEDLADKVERVGGTLLTEAEAIEEIKNYKEVKEEKDYENPIINEKED